MREMSDYCLLRDEKDAAMTLLRPRHDGRHDALSPLDFPSARRRRLFFTSLFGLLVCLRFYASLRRHAIRHGLPFA